MTSNPVGPKVTQRVALADVDDLVSRPARAAIAYVGPDGPECLPVVVRPGSAISVGIDPDEVPKTGVPERVTLVVDDGGYWFDLRAAVWRGIVTQGDDDGRSGEDGLVWFSLDAVRVVAWDYGRLHEEPA